MSAMCKPDQRSAKAKSCRHWYKSKQWLRMREEQLAAHPLCQCPHCREGKGRWAEATVVDHIKPHRCDRKLFFDKKNIQSMSKPCHDAMKQSQERGGHGFLAGCDEHGEPLSHDHEWHKR